MKGKEMKQTIEAIKEALDTLIENAEPDIVKAIARGREQLGEEDPIKLSIRASIGIVSFGQENQVEIKIGFVKERLSKSMKFRVSEAQEELFKKKGERERNQNGTFKS